MKKEEQKEFKISEHLRPLKNQVVVTAFLREDTGIKLLDTTAEDIKREIFYKVEATGSQITDIHIGDLILPRPEINVANIKLLGTEYLFLNEYDILAVVTSEMREMEKEYLKKRAVSDKIIKADLNIIV